MTDAILPFLAATVLFVMAPGPDVFYVVTRTIAQGRMVGFASSLGVSTGAAIHILAAAFGFSVVIQTSATAYALLKYAGAAAGMVPLRVCPRAGDFSFRAINA